MTNQIEIKNLTTINTQAAAWDRETQLAKNQEGLELLKTIIEENENMSDEEARESKKSLEEFKKLVDSYRPDGHKLYLES